MRCKHSTSDVRISPNCMNLLTPCSKGLPEKLTGPQLISKYLAFYGTRRFITAVTTAHHLSLSADRSIQSMPPSHFSKIHFNIILPTTPESYKRSPLFRSPHQNPLCTSLLPHTCYICPSQSSWFDHPNNIWWWVHRIKLLVMYSSPIPCFLVPLRPKYTPQHPILENSQPTFLHQCERPSFTPIWKTAQTLLQINVQQHVFTFNTQTNCSVAQCTLVQNNFSRASLQINRTVRSSSWAAWKLGSPDQTPLDTWK